MAITVEDKFSAATLEIDSTIGIDSEYTACGYGAKCPAQAGVRQTLSVTINKDRFRPGKSGHVKLEIYHTENNTDFELYCVEFPVKVV